MYPLIFNLALAQSNRCRDVWFSGSAICLMDKKGVSLKTAIILEQRENIATNQKLKWFILIRMEKRIQKGKKIASVNSKGVVKGINGNDYVNGSNRRFL